MSFPPKKHGSIGKLNTQKTWWKFYYGFDCDTPNYPTITVNSVSLTLGIFKRYLGIGV